MSFDIDDEVQGDTHTRGPLFTALTNYSGKPCSIGQRTDDKIVVDRVEGLGVISEQNKIVELLLHLAIIICMEVVEVVSHSSTRQKYPLVVTNEFLAIIGHRQEQGARHDAVASVVDRDRPRVGDKGIFLVEEEQNGFIKVTLTNLQ